MDLRKKLLNRNIDPNTGLMPSMVTNQFNTANAVVTDMDSQIDVQDKQALRQGAGEAMWNGTVQLGANILGETLAAPGYFSTIWEDSSELETGLSGLFIKAGEAIKNSAMEYNPILSTSGDKGVQWSDLHNSKFWANSVAQFGPTIALMGVGMVGGGLASKAIMGAVKGLNPRLAKSVQVANKIMKDKPELATALLKDYVSIKGKVDATTAGLLSRSVESGMEAYGNYNDTYDKLKEAGKSHDEAKELASKAAAFTYKANWALGVVDIAQFDMIFKNPIKNKLGKGLSNYGKQALSEGAEEGIQYAINNEATQGALGYETTLSDYTESDEFWESIVQGAMGGMVFQGAGDLIGLVKAKDKEISKTKKAVKEGKDPEDPTLPPGATSFLENKTEEELDEVIIQLEADDTIDPKVKEKVVNEINKRKENLIKENVFVEEVLSKSNNKENTTELTKVAKQTAKDYNKGIDNRKKLNNKKKEVVDKFNATSPKTPLSQEVFDELVDFYIAEDNGKKGKYPEAEIPPIVVPQAIEIAKQEDINESKLKETELAYTALQTDPDATIKSKAEKAEKEIEEQGKTKLEQIKDKYKAEIPGLENMTKKEANIALGKVFDKLQDTEDVELLAKAENDLKSELNFKETTEETLQSEIDEINTKLNNGVSEEEQESLEQAKAAAEKALDKETTIISTPTEGEQKAYNPTAFEADNTGFIHDEKGDLVPNPNDNTVPNSQKAKNAEFILKHGRLITEATIEAQPYDAEENFGNPNESKTGAVQYGIVYSNTGTNRIEGYPDKIYLGSVPATSLMQEFGRTIKDLAKANNEVKVTVKVSGGKPAWSKNNRNSITGQVLGFVDPKSGNIMTPRKLTQGDEFINSEEDIHPTSIKVVDGKTTKAGDVYTIHQDANGEWKAYPVKTFEVKDASEEIKEDIAIELNKVYYNNSKAVLKSLKFPSNSHPETVLASGQLKGEQYVALRDAIDADKASIRYSIAEKIIVSKALITALLDPTRSLVSRKDRATGEINANYKQDIQNTAIFKSIENTRTNIKLAKINKGKNTEVLNADQKGNVYSELNFAQPFVNHKFTITGIISSESTQTEIEAKKDDIERRRQEDLSIGIPTDNYQIVQGNSKDMLIKFREYLIDVLGWEKMPIGYSNKNLTLDYLGTVLKIPAELIEMGGGASTSLGVNIKDVINAKYDAELAALNEGDQKLEAKKADIERRRQEVDRISKLPFAERIGALKKAGIITSNITYNLGKRFPIILTIAGTKVAFYRSSEGSGGKEKGAWTPMFGFGKDKGNPWLIKGDIDTQVNVNYNSNAVQEYADILNKTLNWEHDLDKGQVKNHPYFKEFQLAKNEQAFNEELYGVKDLGIVNKETNVSGFINSKLQEINAKYDAELAALNEGDQKLEAKNNSLENLDNQSKAIEATKPSSTKREVGSRPLLSKISNTNSDEIVASEKTIRDLTARIAARIGIPYEIISDRTEEYKGKIVNGKAYINLAYATLDTPIHEILGHPIIRAIKQGTPVSGEYVEAYTTTENGKENGLIQGYYDKNSYSVKNLKTGEIKLFDNFNDAKTFQNDAMFFGKNTQLYQNLLKELETGRGKEVLDRIKRDYSIKIEARQVANISRNYIDGQWVETKNIIDIDPVYYTLEEQQEEAIVELLGLMTAEKLDNVQDGKLISLLKRLLKEMKSFIRSLLNQKEIEIDKLPDNITINDLSDLLAYSNNKLILPGYEAEYTTPDGKKFKTQQEASNHITEMIKSIEEVDLSNIDLGSKNTTTVKENFEKRKPSFDQTDVSPDLDIIEFGTDVIYEYDHEASQYKKVTYYMGKKANEKYISIEKAFEEFLKTEDGITNFGINGPNSLKEFIFKNKEFEQSSEIIKEWKKVNNISYNPEEVYSRGQGFYSVVGAYSNFDINLMFQNLLDHIEDNKKAGGEFTVSAFTRDVNTKLNHLEGGGGKIRFKMFPQSNDIKWAANKDVYSGSVWDASEKVSKDKKSELLGVSYTKAPSLKNLEDVQPNLANIINLIDHSHNELGISLTGNNFRLEYDADIPYKTKKLIKSINNILDQKYGKLVKPKINKEEKINNLVYNVNFSSAGGEINANKNFSSLKEATDYIESIKEDLIGFGVGKVIPQKIYKQLGIQPTQTKETLKESINSIKNKLEEQNYNEFGGQEAEEGMEFINPKKYNKKEYTSQALINTKIAALKEVAKKYPRSLITSEVVKTNLIFDKNNENENYSLFQKTKDNARPVGDFPKVSKKPLSNEEVKIFTDKEYKWFKNNFPNIPISILKDLREIAKTDAWGAFTLAGVYIQEKAKKGTVYHEAMHVMTELVLDPKQKAEVYELARLALNKKLIRENKKPISKEDFDISTVSDTLYSRKDGNIDYNLKAVDILNSDKAKQVFEKGKKNGWDLNKILTELQVPKEQKQIILDGNYSTYIDELSLRENIIISLQADTSFVVEVNTAKEQVKTGTKEIEGSPIKYYSKSENRYYRDTEELGWISSDENNKNQEVDVKTPEDLEPIEFDKYNIDTFSELETQHYSNLTVPGGTNYTESEIATPGITPNIKGHAQFSTDNGIGWFRSDEQAIGNKVISEPNIEQSNGMTFIHSELEEDKSNSVATKTRRILEVQSDLFQKGRDKKDLVNGKKVTNLGTLESNIFGTEEFKFTLNNNEYESVVELVYYREENQSEPEEVYYKNGNQITVKEFTEAFKEKTSKENSNSNDNKFLQLLNKNNNWVTFFVKSIIQDSVKKGYEKVLFPSGDTAAKIEGHQTLEEFKKQKEDRIKQLEEEKYRVVYTSTENNMVFKYFSNKIDADNFKGLNRTPTLENDNSIELTQLKQELADVESGKTQLSSIAKFYEDTIFNVLKKQGFNPVEITDEYGNKWNEIKITPELKKQVEKILLSNNQKQSKDENLTPQVRIAEYLAEQFEEYKLNKDLEISNSSILKRLGIKIYRFFDKLYHLIKATVNPNIGSLTNLNKRLEYGIKTKKTTPVLDTDASQVLLSAKGYKSLAQVSGGIENLETNIKFIASEMFANSRWENSLKEKEYTLADYIKDKGFDKTLKAIEEAGITEIQELVNANSKLLKMLVMRDLSYFGIKTSIKGVKMSNEELEALENPDEDSLLQSWQDAQYTINRFESMQDKAKAFFRLIPMVTEGKIPKFHHPKKLYIDFVKYTSDSIDLTDMLEKLENSPNELMQSIAKDIKGSSEVLKSQMFGVASNTEMEFLSVSETRAGKLEAIVHNAVGGNQQFSTNVRMYIKDLVEAHTGEDKFNIVLDSAQDIKNFLDKASLIYRLEDIEFDRSISITADPKSIGKAVSKLINSVPTYYLSSIRVGDKNYYSHVPTSFVFKRRAEFKKALKENRSLTEFFGNDPVLNAVFNNESNELLTNKIQKVVGFKSPDKKDITEYSKMSRKEHLKTVLALFNNLYGGKHAITLPVLETSSTHLSVTLDTDDIAFDSSVNILLKIAAGEKARLNLFNDPTHDRSQYSKQYLKNMGKNILLPFMDYNSNIDYKTQIETFLEGHVKAMSAEIKEVNPDIKDKDIKNFLAAQIAYGLYYTLAYTGDLTHFKPDKNGDITADFFKRIKQIYSPGKYLNVDAITMENSKGETVNIIEANVHIGMLDKDGNRHPDIKQTIQHELYLAGVGKGPLDNQGNPTDVYKIDQEIDETDAGVYIDPLSNLLRNKGLGVEDKYHTVSTKEEFLKLLKDIKYERNILKPFIYDMNNGKPLQIKSAEFIIDPYYAFKNPSLKKVAEAMGYIYITDDAGNWTGEIDIEWDKRLDSSNNEFYDMFVPESAIKIGTNYNDAVSIKVKYSSWRKQQDTPNHLKMKDEAVISLQGKKISRSDLPETITIPKDLQWMFEGKTSLSKNDFLEIYDSRLSDIHKAGYKRAEKLFDNSLESRREIENKITEKLLEDNQIDILDSIQGFSNKTNKMSLSHGLVKDTIEPIMASIIRKEVTELKMAGNSLYNVSSYGFEQKGRRKPKLVFDKNGVLIGMEAYIPPIHPVLDKLVGKTNEEVYEALKDLPGLNQMFYYRTPTEGAYSMLRIIPIGIMPVTQGGGIVLPPELTLLLGADFDIDKLLGLRFDTDSKGEIKDTIRNRYFAALLVSKYNTGEASIIPGNFDTLKKVHDLLPAKPKTNSPLTSLSTQLEQKANMSAGAFNIGVFANLVSYFALNLGKNLKLSSKYTIKGLTDEDIVRDDLDLIVDENNINIIRHIGELSAQAVDNGKEPIANALNINEFTAPMLSLLLKMGIPLVESLEYIRSKEMVTMAKEAINSGNVREYMSTILKASYPFDHKFDLIVNLNNISNDDIMGLYSIAEEFTEVIQATRYADKGMTFNHATSLYYLQKTKADFKYFNNTGIDVSTTKVAIDLGLESGLKLLERYLPYGGNLFQTTIQSLFSQGVTMSPGKVSKFYSRIIDYLIQNKIHEAEVKQKVKTFSRDLIRSEEFIAEFRKLKTEGSSLLNYLSEMWDENTNGSYIGVPKVVAKEDRYMFKAYWLELQETNPEFATNLAKYALFRSGVSLTPDSFGYLIPDDIFNEIVKITEKDYSFTPTGMVNRLRLMFASDISPIIRDGYTINTDVTPNTIEIDYEVNGHVRRNNNENYVVVMGDGFKKTFRHTEDSKEEVINTGSIWTKSNRMAVLDYTNNPILELPKYKRKTKSKEVQTEEPNRVDTGLPTEEYGEVSIESNLTIGNVNQNIEMTSEVEEIQKQTKTDC